MAQTIRLFRFSLMLRVSLSLIEAALSAQYSSTAAWLRLVADLPYLVSLVLVLYAERRGWQSVRYLSVLLAGIQLLYSAQVILVAALAGLGPQAPAIADLARQLLDRLRQRDSAGMLVGNLTDNEYSSVPLMIGLVPPMLGTWAGGGRSAPRWASLAAGLELVNRLSIVIALGGDLSWRAQLFDFMTYAIVVGVVCVFVGALTEQEREERRQLQAANRLLAEQAKTREQLAATRERVRVARDLHDTLAHTLAALAVQLETVEAALEHPESTARRQLARASELAQQGLQNAREAILDLRATQVKDLGLVGALRRQVEQAASRGGAKGGAENRVDIRFETDGNEPTLNDAVAEGLVRITQEALNNVIRHAQATHVTVSVLVKDVRPRVLELRVQDDGRGFDITQQDGGRYGLAGMRERAELIGAHFQISSVAGRGTTVTVRLELSEEQPDAEDTRVGGG